MKIEKLYICGEALGDRFSIEIHGIPICLTATSFMLLAKLAHYRKQGINDGWIKKTTLMPGHNQSRYLYRLRREISSEPKTLRYFITNDQKGQYRLDILPVQILINYRALSKHYDISVRQLAEGMVS